MTSDPIPDHDLKALVCEELGWLPDVQADRVGVAVSGGAVVLSGQVETRAERRAAVEAALRIRGVNAVADEIEVVHADDTHRTDEAAHDVDIARVANQRLTHGTVDAEVHHHTITLTGTVGWHYERVAVERAMADIPGVRDVVDHITLVPPVVISERDATVGIAAALRRSAELDAELIDVDVEGSTIILTGRVSTWSAHRTAAKAAWSTPGVTSVENLLTVVH